MNLKSVVFNLLILPRARERLKRLQCLSEIEAVQENTLLQHLFKARDTQFGKDHNFGEIRSFSEYQKKVPIRSYEQFFEEYFLPASKRASEIQRQTYAPDQTAPFLFDVTWPGFIEFFSLSSGTTSGKTKFIPFTNEMKISNEKAILDLMALQIMNFPKSTLFDGKIFFLSGSPALRPSWNGRVHSGDLSGIHIKKLPFYLKPFQFPPKHIASIPDWGKKIRREAEISAKTNISVLGGVPTWALLFLEELNKMYPIKGNIKKLWPHFGLMVHGGVPFDPYRERFREWLGRDTVFQEVYPASEGFVAIEDPVFRKLRMMVDYGIVYEFVPVTELASEHPARLLFRDVECGREYAIVLTNNAGLWSYVIGDTIRFLSKEPPLIQVTGRTKYYLSAFGEHVIQEEVEKALLRACESESVHFVDYHIAPMFPDVHNALGRHQMVIEMTGPLRDQKSFGKLFDQYLQELNEDYAAHRSGGFGLDQPEIIFASRGFFSEWMKFKGKAGGQHKVPRLSGSRDTIEDLLAFRMRFH